MPTKQIGARLCPEYQKKLDKAKQKLNMNFNREFLEYCIDAVLNSDGGLPTPPSQGEGERSHSIHQPSSSPIPNCYYRTIEDDGRWFCDLKELKSKKACLKRQERHLATKNICKPEHLKKRRTTTKKKVAKREYTCINCSRYHDKCPENPHTGKTPMPIDPICEKFYLSRARKNWSMKKLDSNLKWKTDDVWDAWRGSRPTTGD